jgi:hypothetical protein
MATYRSARIRSSTKVLLGGDGGVGGSLKAGRPMGPLVGVMGGTWTCTSVPSQTGWVWHGDTSAVELPSNPDVVVGLSVAAVVSVVVVAGSPTRIDRAASPWSRLRRRSRATARSDLSIVHGHDI